MSDDPTGATGGDEPFEEGLVTASTGDETPSTVALTEEELTRLQSERDEYLDALRRLQADFENYRKRVARDQEAAADRAGEKLVNRLLPVLDTFELARGHEGGADDSPLARMHDALLGALESEGLERVSPTGEAFDPAVAEAVMHEDGEGDGPVVAEVLRAGYLWKGRVVRAAMVKVRG